MREIKNKMISTTALAVSMAAGFFSSGIGRVEQPGQVFAW